MYSSVLIDAFLFNVIYSLILHAYNIYMYITIRESSLYVFYRYIPFLFSVEKNTLFAYRNAVMPENDTILL